MTDIFTLAIYNTKTIGTTKLKALLSQHSSSKSAYHSLFSTNLTPYPLERAYDQIESAKASGSIIITLSDSIFKKLDPSLPPVLYCKGNLGLLYRSNPRFAVVGSRTPTAASINIAKALVPDLNKSYTVVSGLARGIDTIAHLSAKTSIAVIANGLDIIYPKSSTDAHNHILKNNGLIISQYPMGTQPSPSQFVKRNFLTATVANKLLVVEAAANSGSLITLNYAKKLGKPVYAIPGHPNSYKYFGSNYAIKSGAILVQSISDIIDGHKPQSKRGYTDISRESFEFKLFSLLSAEPIEIDQIASIMKLEIQVIQSAVAKMEMLGHIKITNGNLISISYE